MLNRITQQAWLLRNLDVGENNFQGNHKRKHPTWCCGLDLNSRARKKINLVTISPNFQRNNHHNYEAWI